MIIIVILLTTIVILPPSSSPPSSSSSSSYSSGPLDLFFFLNLIVLKVRSSVVLDPPGGVTAFGAPSRDHVPPYRSPGFKMKGASRCDVPFISALRQTTCNIKGHRSPHPSQPLPNSPRLSGCHALWPFPYKASLFHSYATNAKNPSRFPEGELYIEDIGAHCSLIGCRNSASNLPHTNRKEAPPIEDVTVTVEPSRAGRRAARGGHMRKRGKGKTRSLGRKKRQTPPGRSPSMVWSDFHGVGLA